MRNLPIVLALSLFACQDDDERVLVLDDGGGPDASVDAAIDSGLDASLDARVDATILQDAQVDASVIDAGFDAGFDAGLDAGSCKPTVLLQGGSDPAAQGWTVYAMQPSTVTNATGYTRLTTSTTPGQSSGGALLLAYPNAAQVPFAIEVVMQVESVQAHNPLDSAAAILGSLNGNVGNSTDRAQMVFLDSTSLGWADNAQTVAATVVDGNYHRYVLSVDEQNVARLSVDGVAKLTRSNFVTNGTIAVGDQTNDPNVDATLRIESVTKLCL